MNLIHEKKDYFLVKATDMDEFIGHHFCRTYDVVEDESVDSDGCCVWIYPERDNTELTEIVQQRVKEFMNGGNKYSLFFLLYHLCLKGTIPEGIYVVVE